MPALIRTVLSAGSPRTVAGELSSDKAVLTRIASGDKLAMRILFARHQVRIYRFVLRILQDEGMAEDVVSEIFLHVWRNAHRFQARSAVSTWLFGIGRHVAITTLRRRTEAKWDAEVASTIVDPADDPERSTDKKGLSALLQKCLMNLSQAHREIIDLIYYHEMSIDQVAEIVGIPAGTVKTRMFYARKQLSEQLKEAGIDRAA